MKYFLFALFIIGGILICRGAHLTKKGQTDKRYKRSSFLPYFLGLLVWGIMLAIYMIFGMSDYVN